MLLEGPATGIRDEGFCVFLVVYRENAELVAYFTFHRMLIMQPYQYQRQRSAPVHYSHRYRNLTIMQPPPHINLQLILQII